MKLFALAFICWGCWLFATEPAFSDFNEIDQDLRLRIDDPAQARATTSINFSDLGPTSGPSKPAPPRLPTALRVFIDAGHGGKDLGAQGFFSVSEKNLALDIGKRIRSTLAFRAKKMSIPVEILLSRDQDVFISLHDRVQMANEWHADLFVSIHANSSPLRSPHGFEVYFLSADATDAEAKKLAKTENSDADKPEVPAAIQSILNDVQWTQHVSESGGFAEKLFSVMMRKLRSKHRGVRQGPFAVLSGTEMPAALIEVGYVSSPIEAQELANPNYLKKLSGAITDGILEYILETNQKISEVAS